MPQITLLTRHREVSVRALATAHRAACRARSDDGQALVEFALVLPVFVVLLLGIGLFGLALNDWIDETQVASQAARFAAVYSEHGTGAITEESSFISWVKKQGDNSQVKTSE